MKSIMYILYTSIYCMTVWPSLVINNWTIGTSALCRAAVASWIASFAVGSSCPVFAHETSLKPSDVAKIFSHFSTLPVIRNCYTIWRFPDIPLNHLFQWDFPFETIHLWVKPPLISRVGETSRARPVACWTARKGWPSRPPSECETWRLVALRRRRIHGATWYFKETIAPDKQTYHLSRVKFPRLFVSVH